MTSEKIYKISDSVRKDLLAKVPTRKTPLQIKKQHYTRTVWKPLLHRWAAILCKHASSLPVCKIDYSTLGRENYFDFIYESRLEIDLPEEAMFELLQIKSTLQLMKDHPVLKYDGYHRSHGIMSQALLFYPYENIKYESDCYEDNEPHPLAIYLRKYGLPKETNTHLKSEYQKYIESGLIANTSPEKALKKLNQRPVVFYKDYNFLVIHMIRNLPAEITRQDLMHRLKFFDQDHLSKAKKFFLNRILKTLIKSDQN